MKSLYQELEAYGKNGTYPFHMPGHKRNMGAYGFADPFSFDITEIDGFDNLHHAEGILLEAQQRAAEVFGAAETHFLINGSTAGILSAISGCVKPGGKLLMARNCHKAVYHAAFLNELETVYVYPEWEPKYGLNGGISPQEIERLLQEEDGIGAVVITSPTYDGIVSDIRSAAEVVHRYGIPLIVDEAHGAHMRFHSIFPDSAVHLGADVVIQSVHKTLPSMTQTALLHICGRYADAARIRKYLAIYQTSSPSYVLMASIDQCVKLVTEKREELFEPFVQRLSECREALRGLRALELVGEEIEGTAGIYRFDRSKLVLSGAGAGIDGNTLSEILRRDYRIEMEMAAGSYTLGIASVMDTEEGFQRFSKAVKEMDARFVREGNCAYKKRITVPPVRLEQVRRIYEAEQEEMEQIPLINAEGRVSGEYIYLYPPGIPLAAPGERITGAFLEELKQYRGWGLALEGMRDTSGETLLVNLREE